MGSRLEPIRLVVHSIRDQGDVMAGSSSATSPTAAEPIEARAGQPAGADGRPLVVNVVPFSLAGWRWFEADTVGQIRWEFFGASPLTWPERKLRWSSLALTRGCHRAVRFARQERAKLLISHDPKTTYRCAEVNRRLKEPIPHLAWSFNFARLPTGLKRRLMTAAFRDVDRFVVFSTMERELYANYFDVPIDRFSMIHWAMGPLAMNPPDHPTISGDYICSLGGNARDYPTLMAAMALLPDIPLVAVVRPNNLQGLVVPPNVTVQTNIPFPDAINILNYSRFTVVPLVGSEVPCGHVTIVVAMQFGVTPSVTRSTGLDDYAIPDQTAITYKDHDANDLAQQIRRLWDDRALTANLGNNGRQFFADHCAEDVARSALADHLTRYGLLNQAKV